MQEQSSGKHPISKGPVIATIYKPPGQAGKEKAKESPYGEFEEQDFVFGKPLAPKPTPKRYIPIDSEPAQAYRPAKQARPIKDYGKNSQDLEQLLTYFNEWARKFKKGEKGLRVGLVFLPEYRRN